jgi:hypothetical protein
VRETWATKYLVVTGAPSKSREYFRLSYPPGEGQRAGRRGRPTKEERPEHNGTKDGDSEATVDSADPALRRGVEREGEW